ncbi:MAG: prenyltransferase/squalene oxidase repeat-containing protein [Chloroflexota bacterium]|nr:prenyltransferase/squalene oxidase repeat-containing protein [Chloroflexota bacterium]
MKSKSIKTFFAVLISFTLVLANASAVTANPSLIATAQEEDSLVPEALAYLQSQLNPDGGLIWMDENSAVAPTIKVVQALAANGLTQDALTSDEGQRPIDFLASAGWRWVNQEETESPTLSVARAGQLLSAVAAANENPYAFGDDAINLVYELRAQYDSTTGIYGAATPESVTDQIWALIGLAANNAAVPVAAVDWLTSAQLEDGSWDDGYGSFLDTTPLGILALVASGQRTADSPDVAAALGFLTAIQQPNGGWQTEWDTTTNANTTAVILQAIYAVGQNPSDETWRNEDGNPETALAALQKEDGSIGGDFANSYSTADALIGLSGQPMTAIGDLAQAGNAFDFLFSLQDADGGWGNVGQTLDVILALEAAGWQPETVHNDGGSPLDYIAANLDTYLEASPDAIGKAILGVVASGEDPSNFNGVDLTEQLMATYDEATQSFGDPENTWYQALGILGLSAAGSEIPKGVITTLTGLQQGDGGWEYVAGFGSWPDNTSLAIQALLAEGYSVDDPALSQAISYIQSTQTADGGWGDSSTTAYVLMALNALGESEEDWRTETGTTPLTSLMSYQKTNGSFVYTWEYTDDSIMSTASALLALFGGDYLIQPKASNSFNTATIVIDPGEGDAQMACVEFTDESISGLDLLDASGFDYDVSEGFVNSILGIANLEGETNYWSYWAWDGREWTFNNAGASDSVVSSGTVEGWHFTSWESYPAAPPDVFPILDLICDSAPLLKDYDTQPYLGYNDLFNAAKTVGLVEPAEEELEPTEGEATAETTEEAQVTEVVSTGVVPEESAEEESASIIPIIIIAVVAVVLLVVILLILRNKPK